MARIISTLETPDGANLILEVSAPATSMNPDADIRAAVEAAYPPAAGWTNEPTTVDVLFAPHWPRSWITRMAGFVQGVHYRNNEDGSISRIITVSAP